MTDLLPGEIAMLPLGSAATGEVRRGERGRVEAMTPTVWREPFSFPAAGVLRSLSVDLERSIGSGPIEAFQFTSGASGDRYYGAKLYLRRE